MAKETKKQESSGLEPNVAGALSYSLGLITGIVFLIIDKDNKFVKFHAIQSIAVSLVIMVVNYVLIFTIVGIVLIPFLNIAVFALWLYMMYTAYQNKEFMLPIVGKIAKEQSEK